MASSLSEEDLTCPICCDIFTDPVVLSCSHSVCKGCLENYWSEKEENECPLCRRRSSRDDPPVCLPLKNLCEAFSKERARPEEWCAEHSERLKLFCKDDKELICVVCRDSTKHKSHKCSPIEEAAKEIKVEEIKKALHHLQVKLQEFQKTELTCQSMAEHIKRQAEKAEPLIKKEFEKLRAFLEEQENKLLNDLKEEEEKKTKLMEEKKDSIGKKIKSLSSKMETIKKEMEDMESIAFLRDNSVILRSKTLRELEDVPKRPLGDMEKEAEDFSGCLIDMPKHVGNLTYNIWLRMRDICQYSPVLLDPNASGSYMELSDDLTTVMNSYGRLNLPSNPERTSCVLGSKAINNGLFIWEVQVNTHKYWDIGVIKAKTEKGAYIWSRVWCLRSRSVQWSSSASHSIEVPGTSTPLTLDQPPENVRVVLEYDEGKLSFYDGKGKLLHTIEHEFTGDVFPFFDSYYQSEPVKFVSIEPSVSLKW